MGSGTLRAWYTIRIMHESNNHKVELERLLAEITNELQSVGIHNPDNSSDWVPVPAAGESDESDTDLVADAVEDSDERQALVATLEGRYNNLVRALVKIANGTYGMCELGEHPIEADRLEANPAARTCKAHMNDESSLSL